MKGIIFCMLTILILISSSPAQVLNSSGTLRQGKFQVGAFLVDYENADIGIFGTGSYGLGPGFDLGVRLGLGYHETYLGADLEWIVTTVKPFLSIAAGAHVFSDPGLDGTLNITFPINNQVHLYSGLDMDINFAEVKQNNPRTGRLEENKDTRVPIWIFVGTEIGLRNNMSVLFELELDVSDDAWSIFSGGVNFML